MIEPLKAQDSMDEAERLRTCLADRRYDPITKSVAAEALTSEGLTPKDLSLENYDQLCVAILRQQLKDTAGGVAVAQLYGGLSHTRLEFHAKPDKPIAALKSLANPFLNISVARPTSPQGIKPHSWQFFLDACQRRGHQQALALIPEGPTKARHLKALAAAHGTFWRPTKVWDGWERRWPDQGYTEVDWLGRS